MSSIKAVLFDLRNKKNSSPFLRLIPPLKKTNNSIVALPRIKDPKEMGETRRKFDTMLENSRTVLFKAKTVFPFDLFPNEISIDTNQVNIVIKEFFYTARVHSIRIENIMDVFVDVAPFFATIHITDKSFVENLVTIKFLTRKNATKARRIIQGLMIARRGKMNLAALHKEELCAKLEQLGMAKEVNT